MSKQDRQGVRTPADLERKYNLGAASGVGSEQLNQVNRTLSQFMSKTDTKLLQLEENGIIPEMKFIASGRVVHIDGVHPNSSMIAKVSGDGIEPTAVKVLQCGKNLFNKADLKQYGGYPHENGVISANPKCRTLYVPCCEKTTYSISKKLGARFRVAFSTKPVTGTDVAVTGVQNFDGQTKCTVTSSVNAKYLLVYYYHSTYDNDIGADEILDGGIQIEIGDTATEYEAYTTTTYTPNADGTCEIVPTSSSLALSADTTGVNIEIEYSQGINTAVKSTKTGMVSLDRAVIELSEKVEDIQNEPTDILTLNNSKFLENKMRNIRRHFGSAGDEEKYTPLVLIHCSDIHEDGKNLQRINDLYSEFHNERVNLIDDVLHTGDSMAKNFTDADAFNFWTKYGGDGFLNSIGNHDVSCYRIVSYTDGTYSLTDDMTDILEGTKVEDAFTDTGEQVYTATLEGETVYYAYIANGVSKSDCYTRFIEPFKEKWKTQHPEGVETEGYCYYYKDYYTQNDDGSATGYGYRLIVLDACHYDDGQNKWLVDVLADAKNNDLHVIVANHFGTTNKVPLASSFCSLEIETSLGTEHCLDDRALAAIDDFQNDGGVFVCHLCGHSHRDELYYNSDYPKQLFVAVNTAGSIKPGHDFSRKHDTKSQDLLNIIGVDYKQKKLKVFRVGADYDLNMRNVDSFCYDYQNNSLVYTSGVVSSSDENFLTQDEVLELIQNNMPVSAEGVSY